MLNIKNPAPAVVKNARRCRQIVRKADPGYHHRSNRCATPNEAHAYNRNEIIIVARLKPSARVPSNAPPEDAFARIKRAQFETHAVRTHV